MKLRFSLLSIFILTTAMIFAVSAYSRRQDALDLELSRLEGVWESVDVDGFDYKPEEFDFTDSRFKLIRQGAFEMELANNDVVYGVYKKDGNLLYFNESYAWCACPDGIEDLLPAVKWDAPKSQQQLYSAQRRVYRYLLRLKSETDE